MAKASICAMSPPKVLEQHPGTSQTDGYGEDDQDSGQVLLCLMSINCLYDIGILTEPGCLN